MTARRSRRLAGLAAALVGLLGLAGCVTQEKAMPECKAGRRLAIVAQSVSGASLVPCVDVMPAGWSFAALDVESGRTRFWLNSDRAGMRAAEIELTRSCDVRGASEIRSEDQQEGIRRYRRLKSLSPRFVGVGYDVFGGGCVTYRYEFEERQQVLLLPELHEAVALFPREELREAVRRDLGFDLDP